MSLFRKSRKGDRAAAFRPQLESLSDRLLPSVAPGIPTPGGTWTLNGDGASDTVVIRDNGTGGLNNIRVNVNGVDILPNASIWELRLNMGGGHDTVRYELAQPLTSGGYYHELEIDLGDGWDRFDAYVPGIAAGASGLNMYVNGRTGNDTLRAHVYGTISPSCGVGVAMTGGHGEDTLVIDQRVFNPANPYVPGASAWLNIAPNAVFWTNIHGNEGWTDTVNNYDLGNTISLDYRGELDGRLAFNLMGGGLDDEMRAFLYLNPTSTGIVGDPGNLSLGATMLGGAGNDYMTFRIIRNGAWVALANPRIDGGWGFDTAHRSSVVGEVNVEQRVVYFDP
jgi:hypothetical protein